MFPSTRCDAEKFRRITRWGDLSAKVIKAASMRPSDAEPQESRSTSSRCAASARIEIPEFDRSWAHGRRHGDDIHRDHAHGRCRCRPHRTISTAIAGKGLQLAKTSLHAWTRWTIAPADRRAMCACISSVRRLGFITPLSHNFCESVQPRAAHLHRNALYVPGSRTTPADLRAPLRLRRPTPRIDAAIDEAIGHQA